VKPAPVLGGLIDAWYVNASTTGLTWDLTIAAIALTVWILAEAISRRAWWHLVAIPATFCIGVSCGLPLYLFLRSGRPNRIERVPRAAFCLAALRKRARRLGHWGASCPQTP
jgi:hypothetical protein